MTDPLSSLPVPLTEARALAKRFARPSLLPPEQRWQTQHCPDVGHTAQVNSLALSADGYWLYSGRAVGAISNA